MKKRIIRLGYLVMALLCVVGEYVVITQFSPDAVVQLRVVGIPIMFVFFALFFLFFFTGIVFVWKSTLQGLLIGSFASIYLLFRYNGLTKPLYQILLLLIFLSVELFFHQKKREKQER